MSKEKKTALEEKSWVTLSVLRLHRETPRGGTARWLFISGVIQREKRRRENPLSWTRKKKGKKCPRLVKVKQRGPQPGSVKMVDTKETA